jgi:hypothetical protein
MPVAQGGLMEEYRCMTWFRPCASLLFFALGCGSTSDTNGQHSTLPGGGGTGIGFGSSAGGAQSTAGSSILAAGSPPITVTAGRSATSIAGSGGSVASTGGTPGATSVGGVGAGSTPSGTSIPSGGAASGAGGVAAGGPATIGGGGTVSGNGGAALGSTVARGGSSVGGSGGTPTVGGSVSLVGGATSGGGGASGGTLAAAGAAGWTENFSAAASNYFTLVPNGASTATSNAVDSTSVDGRALHLQLAANVQPTPDGGVEAETKATYQYGSFSARLRTASCTAQPNAGVVTGLFTFYNDGIDHNGDGLPDNSEIDFEWLCAEPETVYLTMWTDFRDSDAAHKRVARRINLATGAIGYTSYFENYEDGSALTGFAAQPATIAPIAGYDSSTTEYEYGFDWASDHVTWWMRLSSNAAPIVLWDYRGAASRIPSLAASYMVNVWHTSDWPPEGKPNAIETPSQPVSVWIDWMHYQPI